jgi:ElaB/YqjD/DUF883 family membrane-anchored ribosome-binding protein
METEIAPAQLGSTEPSGLNRSSLIGLVKSLAAEIKTFLQQELELAKAEASEKLAWLTRNAVILAASGFIAYAGLIVFLMGLGWLVAWAFQQAGVQPVLAGFLGLAIIGLLVTAAGAAFVLKSVKVLSSNSLAPTKTLQTVQRLKGTEKVAAEVHEQQPAPHPSSDEMRKQVEATEDRMNETFDELGRRVSPREIKERMKRRIQENPYRSGFLAMAMGLLSGFLLGREFHRS